MPDAIGTQHLLLALLAEEQGPTTRVLARLGIEDHASVAAEVGYPLGPGSGPHSRQGPQRTPQGGYTLVIEVVLPLAPPALMGGWLCAMRHNWLMPPLLREPEWLAGA